MLLKVVSMPESKLEAPFLVGMFSVWPGIPNFFAISLCGIFSNIFGIFNASCHSETIDQNSFHVFNYKNIQIFENNNYCNNNENGFKFSGRRVNLKKNERKKKVVVPIHF